MRAPQNHSVRGSPAPDGAGALFGKSGLVAQRLERLHDTQEVSSSNLDEPTLRLSSQYAAPYLCQPALSGGEGSLKNLFEAGMLLTMTTPLETFSKQYLKQDRLDVRPGDTVKVHQKVQEGGKERVQVFEGIVLARKIGRASCRERV